MDKTTAKKILILVILIVLVGAAAVILSGQNPSNNSNNNNTANQNDRVEVTHTDLSSASTPAEKIPAGMPAGIPVESNSIFESYTMDYKDRGLVQYSLSYTTSQSKEDKYEEYLEYMTDEGYDFGAEGADEEAGSLYGTKDNDDLHVVINEMANPLIVTITYVDRQ